MPFDTALTGIRAASSELAITGNNIANASTPGFKSSRAEFGDVYATSVLGAGSNAIGAGVEIQDISQQFSQGNITFTDSALDLAINGNGFFVLADDGGRTYTRSGAFGLDGQGYMVANNGSRLQGYSADEGGNIDSVIGDLQIQTNIIDPRQTTNVQQSLNFDATDEILSSTGREFSTGGSAVGLVQAAIIPAAAVNGYGVSTFDITNADGATSTFTTIADDSAAATASRLDDIPGLAVSAQTDVVFDNMTDVTSVTLNNITLSVTSMAELETAINQRTNSTLRGVSASVDPLTGAMSVSSAAGTDIRISLAGGPAASIDMRGPNDGAATVLDGTQEGVVGGVVTVIVADGYEVQNAAASAIFQVMDSNDDTDVSFSDVVVNAFEANDSSTYNSATSVTVYDSFGVQHVMTQYFVKQPYDTSDPTSSPNHWVMHAKIDGQDIGEADPLAADPLAATQASYNIYFNENGSLDETLTDEFLVSNWTPLDENGVSNNALGPLSVAQNGGAPFPEPPISSNFVINVSGSTQFGTSFAVNNIDQNGFTAGQLSGLSVDDSGVVFARFTNGESLSLGQVLLADFANQQGLQPVGDSSWAETFESGGANINEPGTASLGAIQAGALEESNVDISEQLVALIIAQRNFQASAKTIETADQTTQTIINLR